MIINTFTAGPKFIIKHKFIVFFMNIAEETAKLSSARRLKVGCIAVKDDRIISIGYNGMPSGWDNNCEHDVNGTLVTRDEVIHAEINLLAKLAKSNDSANDSVVYITHAPCIECSKAIYQSGIGLMIYKNDFRSSAGVDFLRKCGFQIYKYDEVINNV